MISVQSTNDRIIIIIENCHVPVITLNARCLATKSWTTLIIQSSYGSQASELLVNETKQQSSFSEHVSLVPLIIRWSNIPRNSGRRHNFHSESRLVFKATGHRLWHRKCLGNLNTVALPTACQQEKQVQP